MRTLPAAPDALPQASMTNASFTETQTISSTPFDRILSASVTKPGRCFIEHVGVNAPGTANSTTRLPLNNSPTVTSLGAPSRISLSFTSAGRLSPTLIAMEIPPVPDLGDVCSPLPARPATGGRALDPKGGSGQFGVPSDETRGGN